MATKAKESPQVLKMRRKLRHQMDEELKRLTPKALQETRKVIENWIVRHKGERINLRSKAIAVFDENQHSAKIHSKFVMHMLEDLKHDESKPKSKTLAGRVTG